MPNHFQQLVNDLTISSPSSIVNLSEITCILQKQNSELLPSFISESYPSILILEKWTWQIFIEDTQQWFDKAEYLQLFQTLAAFNKNLIFHYDTIEPDTKTLLLIPETDECILRIFEHINQLHDDNHPFIRITSLWFDNLSYLVRENPQLEASIVISSINRHITRKYVMTDRYKHYLTELRQSPVPQSIFTAKQLFYIKTCSSVLSAYLFAKAQDFTYTAEEILGHFSIDYTQTMIQHTYTIESWSPELFTCITSLGLMFGSCSWWGGLMGMQTNAIFSTETAACEYIDALIRIIGYKLLHRSITEQRDNDCVLLLDITLFSVINIAQNQDFIWFLRSKMSLPETLLTIAETSPCEKISLCSYAILGEVLTDQRLKELKICDNVIVFFFNMLEHAWHHPSKTFKNIPIYYLLKGFISFSKIDAIQQKTADANKVPLLTEMCDDYPMIFDILWALSFNQDIQEQLRSNTSFMAKLARFPKKCDDEQSRKVTHGILWNLESNHETRAIIDEKIDEKIFDIMISYSHKDSTICRKIYDELTRAGFLVWIDFDQMHGNVMDAMAQAIEQSRTVVICISEQYRRSNYCRAEAHYAFQRQLHIVPILLDEHYKPDGWLLFLLGQLLYVNFGKYEFSRAMKMLITEIQAVYINKTTTVVVKQSEKNVGELSVLPVVSSPLTTEPLEIPDNILEWTQTHVHDWLITHKLVQMSRMLSNSDGRGLVYFHNFIKNSETQDVLLLLKEDSLRFTNTNLSLVELSCFQSLMDRQRNLVGPINVVHQTKVQNNKSITNGNNGKKKKHLVCCRMM